MKEAVFHRVWEDRHFRTLDWRTTDGTPVRLVEPGVRNPGAGPDFRFAVVEIGGLRWCGDVELHVTCADWYRHGHHTDPIYNRALLHVVWEEHDAGPVLRADGTACPTVVAGGAVRAGALTHWKRAGRWNRPACHGMLADVPEAVVMAQLEAASAEYFDRKCGDVAAFWTGGPDEDEAWRRAVGMALFDALGIPRNRLAMRDLFVRIARWDSTAPWFEEAVLKEAEPLGWEYAGARPASAPRVRIRQAARLWARLRPPGAGEDLRAGFERWVAGAGLGPERRGVVYRNVWCAGAALRQPAAAARAWRASADPVPEASARPLRAAGFPPAAEHHAGTPWMMRGWCGPKRCGQCRIGRHLTDSGDRD